MDSQDILGNMVAALKGELGQGYSVISSFVQNQCYLLARQAENIATSRATGSLRNDDELFAFSSRASGRMPRTQPSRSSCCRR